MRSGNSNARFQGTLGIGEDYSYPSSYYALAKANLKVRNYFKVFQIFLLIIFYYRGLRPLSIMIFKDMRKFI